MRGGAGGRVNTPRPWGWSRLRRAARAVRGEAEALALVARDPRTGWAPRLVAGLVVAYVLSPLDPIPDVIPVLGLLDELVVVPLGVALAVRLTPTEVLADARARVAAGERGVPRAGVALVLTLWAAAAVGFGLVVARLLG